MPCLASPSPVNHAKPTASHHKRRPRPTPTAPSSLQTPRPMPPRPALPCPRPSPRPCPSPTETCKPRGRPANRMPIIASSPHHVMPRTRRLHRLHPSVFDAFWNPPSILGQVNPQGPRPKPTPKSASSSALARHHYMRRHRLVPVCQLVACHPVHKQHTSCPPQLPVRRLYNGNSHVLPLRQSTKEKGLAFASHIRQSVVIISAADVVPGRAIVFKSSSMRPCSRKSASSMPMCAAPMPVSDSGSDICRG